MRRRVEGQTVDGADLSLRDRGSNRLASFAVGSIAYHAERDRRILLIHGYNVAERGGQSSMAQLRYALTEGCAELGSQIMTITWPGNEGWLRGGPAAYFAKVDVARRAGRLLYVSVVAEHRNDMGSRELVIIAHSLGCRVTLEFLRHLDRADRPPRLERVVVMLMAAAVPTELNDLYDAARQNADEIVVLHSTDDTVLRRWFRLGQTVAREGRFPEALGYAGNPRVPPWSYQQQMVGYDHGDYWLSSPTADVIGAQLQAYFPDVTYRAPEFRPRRLSERPLLDDYGYLPEYGLPEL